MGWSQKSISIYHREVELLSKFRGIRTLAALDRPNKGLLQADDPVFTGMGVVIVHLLLLGIDQWNHLNPLQKLVR